MAVQLINIGNIANDGTGDDLREAMIKINANFEELDLRDDEQTTASNLGDIGEGIFFRRNNYDLEFKKISAGNNITLTADDDKIVIAAPDVVESFTISSDIGEDITGSNEVAISLIGGNNIQTTNSVQGITIDYTGVTDLVSDPSPQLGADLDAQANNLLNVGTISSSGISGPLTGNVTGLVHGVDIRNINYYFEEGAADFGGITTEVTNLIEFLIYNNDIDWGSFVTPTGTLLDLGTFAE